MKVPLAIIIVLLTLAMACTPTTQDAAPSAPASSAVAPVALKAEAPVPEIAPHGVYVNGQFVPHFTPAMIHSGDVVELR